MVTNEMIDYCCWKDSGTDFCNLGRWSWVTFGTGNHVMQVVLIYSVGRQMSHGWGRVYQQHLHNIQTKRLLQPPANSSVRIRCTNCAIGPSRGTGS